MKIKEWFKWNEIKLAYLDIFPLWNISGILVLEKSVDEKFFLILLPFHTCLRMEWNELIIVFECSFE